MHIKYNFLNWVPCDSHNGMEACVPKSAVIDTLVTSDANTCGYFKTPTGDQYIQVGYASVGLSPQALLLGQRLFIGIDECFVGYDLSNRTRCFSYRMPMLFHEFSEIGDPLIIRDEMGFVGMTQDGNEIWKFMTEGVIESYTITPVNIYGVTTEGLKFLFELPAK